MHQDLIDDVVCRFAQTFGRPATFVVRAPGRINLLGEHTDYNGLPVLPMAIDRCVLIAGAMRADTRVHLANINPKFAGREFEIGCNIPSGVAGDWGNYAKAAVQGLATYGAARGGPRLKHGADLLVAGNIPAGAGLSSSSALVVASALALLAANEEEVAFTELAELLPIAERYVGTLSGGMDQAASLLAQEGRALRIDFFPLRTRTVPLPPGYAFVVCHSLVEAEKAGAAKHAYNLRVIECRLVCRALEHALGSALPHPLSNLGDLVRLFPGRRLDDFLGVLSAILPDRALSLAEIATRLGQDVQVLRQQCAVPSDVGEVFCLLPRARHVLREAERVNDAEALLLRGDAIGFAGLMDASHASCRDDYAISCPELEQLVRCARDAGALGARLTGAGFGGCTVNLVANEQVPSFLEYMDRFFYRERLLARGLNPQDFRFVFQPQAGAQILRLHP